MEQASCAAFVRHQMANLKQKDIVFGDRVPAGRKSLIDMALRACPFNCRHGSNHKESATGASEPDETAKRCECRSLLFVSLHAHLRPAARLQSAFLSMVESGGQHKKEPVHVDINERSPLTQARIFKHARSLISLL